MFILMQTCTQAHPASATIFTWLCQALVDVVSTSHSSPSMCTGAGEARYTILSWGEREREREGERVGLPAITIIMQSD